MKISLQKPSALFWIIPVLLSLCFLIPPPAEAADSSDPVIFIATTTNAKCSDYYNINSVNIDIKPNNIRSSAGSNMNFSGYVLNNNKYPVVDGKLYAKILRMREKNDGNGPDVLDTFVIKDNISLKAGEKLPVDFDWKIPAFATGGKYKLATYLISGDRFNLAGLSFTDIATGGLSSFDIKSQQSTGVFFKRDGIKINNKPYLFTVPPTQNATGSVNVSIPISNTTKIRQVVNIESSIYKWDAQSLENKLETNDQILVIEPGKVVMFPILVRDNRYSVYYIETVLKYRDSKSILGIRFTRNKIDMPMINFSSVSSYPLVSGQKNNVFVCFNNASNNNIPIDGKVKFEILEGDDNSPILSYEYSGKIGAGMTAVLQDFLPSSNYKNFKIHTTIYNGSEIADEVYTSYLCDQIDPENCSNFNFFGLGTSKWLTIVLYVLGGIIVLFLIMLLVMRSNKIKMYLANRKKGVIKTLVLLIMLVSAFSTYQISYATTASSSGSGSGSCPTVSSLQLNEAPLPAGDWVVATTSKACTIKNRCQAPTAMITMKVVGTDLDKIKSVNFMSRKVEVTIKTPTEMMIKVPRYANTDPRFITFFDDPYFASCMEEKAFSFVCDKPVFKDITPTSGKTTGGTFVTITGKNLDNVSAIKVGHATIRDFTYVNPTTLTFTTQAQTKGWKDVGLQNSCGMTHEWITRKNAFLYYKVDDDVNPPPPPPPPPPPIPPIDIDVGGGDITSTTTTSLLSYLYYWTGRTASSTGYAIGTTEKWSTALADGFINKINYETSVTNDSGETIYDNGIVPLGTNLHFNFDSYTTTPVVWGGNPYVEGTDPYTQTPLPYDTGSFIEDAAYPAGNICDPKNLTAEKSFKDEEEPYLGEAKIYIPLSVNPSSKFISFNDGTNNGGVDQDIFFNWKTPPLPDNDSNSWSCNLDNTICSPISTGLKYIYMYYSPTYGSYYYGWSKTTGDVCKTNEVPLHEKAEITVNNQGLWSEINSGPYYKYNSITSSADGTKLAAAVGGTSGGYIYTSTDSGATWVQNGSTKIWQSITSSPDGTKLAAVAANDYIYTSADSGDTWTQKTFSTTKVWTDITSSSDGTKLAAVDYYNFLVANTGYIWISTSSGTTWTGSAGTGGKKWRSITSDSTGTKLAAAVDGGYIYVSSNSGSTWATSTSSVLLGKKSWIYITSSTDGTKLAAVAQNSYIYTSTDSGITWATSTGSMSLGIKNWYSITSSADGTKLAAVVYGGYIYTSVNSGATWTQQTSADERSWQAITSDASGTKLKAVISGTYGGYIWKSPEAVVVPSSPTCIFGTAGCTRAFSNNLGEAVGCYTDYPFYNDDTNLCYATYSDYLSSFHEDLNIIGTGMLAQYYYPYQLNFIESFYNLNITVSSSSTKVPANPVVTGPTEIAIGQDAVYSAVSDLSTAKNKSNSFFANILFAFKRVFADEDPDAVGYRFDWNNDGTPEDTRSPYSYGVTATASHTWSETGDYTLAVQAFDMTSGLSSDWVTLDITVSEVVENNYDAPDLTGSYCTETDGTKRLTLDWNSISGATSYILYSSAPATTPATFPLYIKVGDTLEKTIDSYDTSHTFSMYAVGPRTVTSTEEDLKASPSATANISSVSMGACTPEVPPTGGPTITNGVKFYAKGWADSNSTCAFWGSANTTVTLSDGTTYLNTVLGDCFVNDSTLGKFALTQTDTYLNRYKLGKNTLYCEMTYDGPIVNDEQTRSSVSTSFSAKCSKVPDVIEK